MFKQSCCVDGTMTGVTLNPLSELMSKLLFSRAQNPVQNPNQELITEFMNFVDFKYTQNLNNNLKVFDINVDILKGTKDVSYISGSMVIQSVLGKKWDNSDVDLYITKNDIKLIEKRLKDSGYYLNTISNNYGNIGFIVYKFGKYSNVKNEHGESKIVRVKVDVVIVDGPMNDFFDLFDMDICATRYDPRNKKFIFKNRHLAVQGISHYKEQNFKNGVKKPNNGINVFYKYMGNYKKFLQLGCYYEKNEDRITKYKKRGIKFYFDGKPPIMTDEDVLASNYIKNRINNDVLSRL